MAVSAFPRPIQEVVEPAESYAEAEQMIEYLALQEGFVSARVVAAEPFAVRALYQAPALQMAA